MKVNIAGGETLFTIGTPGGKQFEPMDRSMALAQIRGLVESDDADTWTITRIKTPVTTTLTLDQQETDLIVQALHIMRHDTRLRHALREQAREMRRQILGTPEPEDEKSIDTPEPKDEKSIDTPEFPEFEVVHLRDVNGSVIFSCWATFITDEDGVYGLDDCIHWSDPEAQCSGRMGTRDGWVLCEAHANL